MSIEDTTTQVVGVAALLGTIEKAFKPIRRARTAMLTYLKKRKENSVPVQINSINEAIGSLQEQVSKILYQVSHNGGEAMRDDISVIRREVQTLALVQSVGLEIMDEGVFRCTKDGRNYLINRAYANMLGVTKEELLDNNWLQWFPDEEFKSKLLASLEAGASLTARTSIVNSHGDETNVRVKLVRFQEDFEGRITAV